MPLASGVVRKQHIYTKCLNCYAAEDGHPILTTASSSGHIAIWDLNEGGRLLHMIRGAHDGAISSIEWIPGQPVFISSGEDNSVKVCAQSPSM